MFELVLSGLEVAINRYLQLDPETIKRLSSLENKIIKIEIIDWKIAFFVKPNATGLQLLTDIKDNPDAVIKGPLSGLIQVTRQKGGKVLFKNKILLEGDTEIAQRMRDILQKVDIDWEEQLSHLVGDSVAHKCNYYFQELIQFGQRSMKIIGDNIKEYLHEEKELFPSTLQADEFYQHVGRLRDDVERMEARIDRLLKIKKENAP